MKKKVIFSVVILSLLTIGVCLGCATKSDNEQIRDVITKYYNSDGIGQYRLCTSNYNGYDYEAIMAALYSQDADRVEIIFSSIDVNEDYATAEYRVTTYDNSKEIYERTTRLRSGLIRSDGRWKLTYTTS